MMNDHPYDCPKCGASGHVRLIEGDYPCPECGEHLWTVRPRPVTTDPRELVPAAMLPILPGRPALKPPGGRFFRLSVRLLQPLVVLWLIFRQSMLEARVNDKLNELGDHPSRETVEQVLGEPCYAVSGEICEDDMGDPDLIECYESEGCCVDLWFKDDRLIDITGFVKPSVCELILAGVKP